MAIFNSHFGKFGEIGKCHSLFHGTSTGISFHMHENMQMAGRWRGSTAKICPLISGKALEPILQMRLLSVDQIIKMVLHFSERGPKDSFTTSAMLREKRFRKPNVGWKPWVGKIGKKKSNSPAQVVLGFRQTVAQQSNRSPL
jgi:hypothetical protein